MTDFCIPLPTDDIFYIPDLLDGFLVDASTMEERELPLDNVSEMSSEQLRECEECWELAQQSVNLHFGWNDELTKEQFAISMELHRHEQEILQLLPSTLARPFPLLRIECKVGKSIRYFYGCLMNGLERKTELIVHMLSGPNSGELLFINFAVFFCLAYTQATSPPTDKSVSRIRDPCKNTSILLASGEWMNLSACISNGVAVETCATSKLSASRANIILGDQVALYPYAEQLGAPLDPRTGEYAMSRNLIVPNLQPLKSCQCESRESCWRENHMRFKSSVDKSERRDRQQEFLPTESVANLNVKCTPAPHCRLAHDAWLRAPNYPPQVVKKFPQLEREAARSFSVKLATSGKRSSSGDRDALKRSR